MTIRTHKYVNKVCGSILQYVVFQTKNEINLSVMQDAGRKGTYPNCPGEDVKIGNICSILD